VPVRDSEPVEPNGYTPWWEQHEGTNIRGLSRECAVGYLRMIFRPVQRRVRSICGRSNLKRRRDPSELVGGASGGRYAPLHCSFYDKERVPTWLTRLFILSAQAATPTNGTPVADSGVDSPGGPTFSKVNRVLCVVVCHARAAGQLGAPCVD
jgi:hypothetical protein